MTKDLSLYLKGGAQGVLLLHSYTGNPNELRGLARRLERDGYTVSVPTLKGHGTEDIWNVIRVPAADWFEQVLTAYDQLKADGCETVAVFGLSMGGILANYVAQHRPVAALGTFSAPVMAAYLTEIDAEMQRLFKNDYPEATEAEQDEFEQRVSEQIDELNDFTLELRKHYQDLELPVFIGQGADDQMINPHEAELYKEALKQAEVEYHSYEKAPHVITIGRYGVHLQRDVRAFLERVYPVTQEKE